MSMPSLDWGWVTFAAFLAGVVARDLVVMGAWVLVVLGRRG